MNPKLEYQIVFLTLSTQKENKYCHDKSNFHETQSKTWSWEFFLYVFRSNIMIEEVLALQCCTLWIFPFKYLRDNMFKYEPSRLFSYSYIYGLIVIMINSKW